MERVHESTDEERVRRPPAQPDAAPPAPDPRVAGVLAMQHGAGNAAVAALVSRQLTDVFAPPKPRNMSVPGDDPLETLDAMEREREAMFVPFSPHDGDPVPGYATPREQYTDADKERMNDAIGDRMVEHNRNVQRFEQVFCQSLVRLWGRHLTAEMQRAATPAELPLWARITKFVGEAALAAVLPGGLGLLAGGLLGATFGRTATYLGQQLTAFAADQIGDHVVEKGQNVEGKVAAERRKLDAETEMVAGLVAGMHEQLGGVINVQWHEYGEFVWRASPQALAALRLPKPFPAIDAGTIETGVAAAVVSGLNLRPHAHEVPDHVDDDPTRNEALRFFDDNQVIAHLTAGPGHSVLRTDAQIYAPPTLRDLLVGRPLGSMGPIPMIIPVAPQSHGDSHAAIELLWAIEDEQRRLSGQPEPPFDPTGGREVIEDEEARVSRPVDAEPEPFPWPQFHPHMVPSGWRERRHKEVAERPPTVALGRTLMQDFQVRSEAAMRINRVRDEVTVYGGGLAEKLWLYRWARGDDLSSLAARLVASRKGGFPGLIGNGSSWWQSDLWALASLIGPELDSWLTVGAENLIAQHLTGVVAGKPDDRWDEDYFDKPGRGFTRAKQR